MLRSFWTIPTSLSILAKSPGNHLCDSLLVLGRGWECSLMAPLPTLQHSSLRVIPKDYRTLWQSRVCRLHRVLEDKLGAEQEDSLWAAMRWATFLSVGSCIETGVLKGEMFLPLS